MHRFRKCFFAILFHSGVLNIHAQKNHFFQNSSVGLQLHYGSFFTSLPKSVYIKDSYTYFGELSISWQTDGSEAWHKANGFPAWGAAIFFGNSGSKKYIGYLSGGFLFVDFNLLKLKNFRSTFRVGGGIGLIQKPYDPVTNHKNLLLGSRANTLISFLWKHELRLSEHVYFNGGLSFTHLSNGKIKLPNLGLNTPAFSAGIRYQFNNPVYIDFPVKDPFSKKIFYYFIFSTGARQAPSIGSKTYLINTFSAGINRQFSSFANYGTGFMFSYDRSAGDHYNDPFILNKEILKHRFNAAVYISYEQLIGKFSVPVNLGVYLIEKAYGRSVYQAFGIKYHLNDHWSAGIYFKNHFGHADYTQLGLGYQL